MGYAPRLLSQRSPQERTIRNRPNCSHFPKWIDHLSQPTNRIRLTSNRLNPARVPSTVTR